MLFRGRDVASVVGRELSEPFNRRGHVLAAYLACGAQPPDLLARNLVGLRVDEDVGIAHSLEVSLFDILHALAQFISEVGKTDMEISVLAKLTMRHVGQLNHPLLVEEELGACDEPLAVKGLG